jgi:predicted Zn-dependent protease
MGVVRAVAAAAVASFALVAVSSAAGEPSAWGAAESTAASRTVDFVPLGKFPRGDANALARHVRRELGVRTDVRSPVAIPRSMFNGTRKQYVAQELITLLSRPATSDTVVIGLTSEDMYSAAEAFRFTFSLRSPQGFAVVSRTRMDPRELGLTPDPALRMRRLQKMVLKNIQSLAFDRPLSANPRSVMFGSILSVDDLDYMTEEVRPAKPTGARRAWLSGSDRVCKSAVASVKALFAGATLDTREEFFTFMRESLQLRERHRSELAAVPGAPEDRSGVRALIARFGKANAADRAQLAALEARWTDAAVRAWGLASARRNYALKAGALELGSLACGRYFDPQTYGG